MAQNMSRNDGNTSARIRGTAEVPPNGERQWDNPLEKIEELLTCPICLDRYKIPKLLPCQHTFCMEPCLDGLVDSVRRILKCPECRAEHPLPYDGVKAFQTNYTLMGFLEIHLQACEENAEELESYIRRYNLERCKVCDEKAEVILCPHCDKKICLECKNTHIEMVKRDLYRLMNQIRRLSNRITDASDGLSKGADHLTLNCETVVEEIKDVTRRYMKEVKKREEQLLADLDTFRSVETGLMRALRQSLELESSNINEACARVEACLKGEREASDEDLVHFKHMFSDGLDYLRTFSPDADDLCMKKIRFSVGQDPYAFSQAITQFGELHLCTANFAGRFQQLESYYVPHFLNLGLIGLESDQQQLRLKKRQWDFNDSSTWTQQNNSDGAPNGSGRRFASGTGGRRPQPPEEDHRLSVRYRRRQQLEEESWRRIRGESTISPDSRHSPRIVQQRDENEPTLAREHIERSPFNRVQQVNNGGFSENAEQRESSFQTRSQLPRPIGRISVKRESSEDQSLNEKVDNIRREYEQKQNKPHPPQIEPTTSSTAAAAQPPKPPIQIRTVTAKIQSPVVRNQTEERGQKEGGEEEEEEEEEEDVGDRETNTTVKGPVESIPIVHYPRPATAQSRRSCAPDFDSISTADSNRRATEAELAKSGSQLDWKKYLIPVPKPAEASSRAGQNGESAGAYNMAQSFNFDHQRSSSRDSDSECSWGERRMRFVRSKTNPELLTSLSQSKINESAESEQKAVGNHGGYRGKFLQPPSQSSNEYRRRFGAGRQDSGEDDTEPSGNHRSNAERRNRYRRKAEKSHTGGSFGGLNSVENCEVTGHSDGGGTRFYRVFTQPRIDYLEKGRVRRKFGTKGSAEGQFNWPRGLALIPSSEEVVVCDSSNHRVQMFDRRGQFSRSFGGYGNSRGEFDCLAGIAVNKFRQFVVTDRYNHRVQVFDSSGRYVREFGNHGQTNGRFNNPWGVVVDNQGFIYVCDKDNHRVQIFQADGNFVGKFGVMGNREGQFQNPHFIAVNRQNQLFVTDSSNHRVQVFDHNGHFIFAFGSEGFHEGQFKYPRGIAIDDQGFVVVADSGNNRIQVFYPDGRFYAEFGTWGSAEGQLKGVEGLAVTLDGYIYVSDRENHRIQAF